MSDGASDRARDVRLDLSPHEAAVLLLIFKIGQDTYEGRKIGDEVFMTMSRAPVSLVESVIRKLDGMAEVINEL